MGDGVKKKEKKKKISKAMGANISVRARTQKLNLRRNSECVINLLHREHLFLVRDHTVIISVIEKEHHTPSYNHFISY